MIWNITKVKTKWLKNRNVINHLDPQPKGMFENRYLECSIKIKGDRGFMISFTFYMKVIFIADVCGRKAKDRLFKPLNCMVENMRIYRKRSWKAEILLKLILLCQLLFVKPRLEGSRSFYNSFVWGIAIKNEPPYSSIFGSLFYATPL